MMIRIKNLSSLYLVLMALTITSVQAASYRFEQRFPDGGKVTGTFEGEDTFGKTDSNGNFELGADGFICFAEGGCYEVDRSDEFSNFSIHFSGNSEFNSFNNNFGVNLMNLFYSIHDNSLAIRYATPDIFEGVPGYFEYNHEKIVMYFFDTVNPELNLVDSREISPLEPITVSQVPLPGALLFFLSAVVGLLGIKPRQLSTENKLPF